MITQGSQFVHNTRLMCVCIFMCAVTKIKTEPAVYLTTLEPHEAMDIYHPNIVFGTTVKMRCQASNMTAGDAIGWMGGEDDEYVFARNGSLLTSNARYKLETIASSSTDSVTEVLTIQQIIGTETNFACFVNDTALDIISFLWYRVIKFPSFVNCFPNGPFTVQEGQSQRVSCVADKGIPSSEMSVIRYEQDGSSPFPTDWPDESTNGDEKNATKEYVFEEGDDGRYYDCKVTSIYFSGRENTCTIGPIRAYFGGPTTTVKPATTSAAVTTYGEPLAWVATCILLIL